MSFKGEEEPPTKQSVSKERDGFNFLVGEFTLPEDLWGLDPQSKRTVTICNLFVNHHLNISEIVRVLDEDRRNVLLALINEGILRDRRGNQEKLPDGRDRRKPLISPKVILRTA